MYVPDRRKGFGEFDLHSDRGRVTDEGFGVSEHCGVLGVAEQVPRAGQRPHRGVARVHRVVLAIPGVGGVRVAEQLRLRWGESLGHTDSLDGWPDALFAAR